MADKQYERVRLPRRTPAAPVQHLDEPQRRRPTAPPNGVLCALLSRIRRSGSGDAFVASPTVEQTLSSTRGNGRPLPSPAREQMESAFGSSFEGVSLHTDADADQLTRQVDAVAFTHGRDIYFSSGSFAPETTSGKKLLAHELTHVVQQRSGRKVMVGAAHDPAETEADAVAQAVVGRLQRQEISEEDTRAVRRQSEADAEEEYIEPLRRQETPEEEALPLRRQAEPEEEEEEEEVQPLRRQTSREEEELQDEQASGVVAAPTKSAPTAKSVGTQTAAPQRSAAEAATQAATDEAPAPPEQRPAEPQSESVDAYDEGVAAYRAGELSKALDLFKQVVEDKAAPENHRASAIWNIGRIYQDMGDDRAALTMYRTYLAQPSIPDERREVAQRIVEDMAREETESPTGATEEAPTGAAATERRSQLPANPEQRGQALQGLASQAYLNGDYATALEHFQQIMRTEGLAQQAYTETLYNMGQCYRRMGNNGAAIDMYRGFIQQPDASDRDRATARRLIATLQR